MAGCPKGEGEGGGGAGKGKGEGGEGGGDDTTFPRQHFYRFRPPSPPPSPFTSLFLEPFPPFLFVSYFFSLSSPYIYIYFSLPNPIFAFLHVLLSLSASHFFCFQFFLSLPPPSLLSFVSPFLPLRGFSLPPEGRRERRRSVRATVPLRLCGWRRDGARGPSRKGHSK